MNTKLSLHLMLYQINIAYLNNISTFNYNNNLEYRAEIWRKHFNAAELRVDADGAGDDERLADVRFLQVTQLEFSLFRFLLRLLDIEDFFVDAVLGAWNTENVIYKITVSTLSFPMY
jgi:hypothetical protein